MLLAAQLAVIVVCYLVEFGQRRKFTKNYKEALQYVHLLNAERQKSVKGAADAFKRIGEQIHSSVTGGKMGKKKAMLFLLGPQKDPMLDYQDNKAYDRVLRLFADGGPWKHIHSVAVSDPSSKVLETFINNIDQIGVRVDGGPLVKLVGIMMATGNLTFAGMVMNTLRSTLVDLTLNDVSILLNYCLSSLLRLQTDLCVVLTDSIEAKNTLWEIQTIRGMIVNVIERYEDYKTRMMLMNVKLPDGKRRIKDALVGADHVYVLSRIEPKAKGILISSRLSCSKSTVGRDLVSSKEIYSELTTSTMAGVSSKSLLSSAGQTSDNYASTTDNYASTGSTSAAKYNSGSGDKYASTSKNTTSDDKMSTIMAISSVGDIGDQEMDLIQV